MKKRLFALFLCLCMVLTLLPTAALASEQPRVIVGGVEMYRNNETTTYLKNGASALGGDENDYNAKYDPETNTLTLKDFVYSGAGSSTYAIYAGGDLTIELEGASSVTSAPNIAQDDSYGVLCSGKLTIQGSGSLTAVAGGEARGSEDHESAGLKSSGAGVKIQGSATVVAQGGEAKYEACSCGIIGSSVEISGNATVIATGGAAGADGSSHGIYSGDVIFSGGVTVARAGTVEALYTNEKRYAVYCYGAEGITLNETKIAGAVGYNGATLTPLVTTGKTTVTVNSGKKAIGGTYGDTPTDAHATGAVIVPTSFDINNDTLEYSSGNNNIANNTAVVTADATAVSVRDEGAVSVEDEKTLLAVSLYEGGVAPTSGITGSGTMVLNGAGKVIAVGGMTAATSSGINSSGELLLSHAGSLDITAIGGTALSGSHGIYSTSGAVTLSGAGSVTAVGGAATESHATSSGIGAGTALTISNEGDSIVGVTAIGGAAAGGSYGLFSEGSGITINNGGVAAIGATKAMSAGPTLNGAVVSAGAWDAKLVSVEPQRYPIGPNGEPRPVPTTSWARFADVNWGADGDYTINTPAELAAFAAAVNGGNDFSGKTVTLAADLDMSGHIWTPIGDIDHPFKGTFEGGGHSISGLYYNGDAEYVGLFGYVHSGTVKNVTVENCYLSSSSSDQAYVGGIAGCNYGGTITNCTNSGSVSASGSNINGAGGVAGVNDGTVTNCCNTGSVSASGSNINGAGGMAGVNNGNVTNCCNSGSVSASGSGSQYAGGVAGYNGDTVTNCCNSGSVSASGSGSSDNNAGGVAGYNGGGGIANCYNTGSVSASGSNINNNAGGVAGYSGVNTVTNCYYKTGTAEQGVGGVAAGQTGTTALPDTQMKAATNTTELDGAGWSAITVGETSLGKVALVDALNEGAKAHNKTNPGINRLAAMWTQSGDNYPALWPLRITTTELPTGRVGEAYSVTLETTHQAGGLIWGMTVADPDEADLRWLSLDESGVISGTPTVAGTFRFPVRVGSVDFDGDTKYFSITIEPAQAPVYVPTAQTVSVDVSAGGERTTLTATISGGKATVGAPLEQWLGGVEAPSEVAVGIKDKGVTQLELTNAALAKVAGDGSALNISLAVGTLRLDKAAVDGLFTLSNGKSVEFTIEPQARAAESYDGKLLEKTALTSMELAISADGTAVKQLGGSIKAELDVSSIDGLGKSGVYTTDEDGNLEYVMTYLNGDVISFYPPHFSPYYLVEFPFDDVTGEDWFMEDAAFAYLSGLVDGVDNTTFAPTQTVTRGMMVTLLHRLAGEPVVNYLMTFKDVPEGQWYTEAIRWAASEKIVDGYDEQTFGPNDPITREQLAAMLYRYEQHKGGGFKGSWMFLLDFPDRADVSEWADEAMHWCVMKGLIEGSDGSLLPQGSAQRAQAAAILHRYCAGAVKQQG